MSEYKDFTSMPPEQEQQFVVFEKHSVETGNWAKKLGMIVAGVFGVVVCVVVLSFDAPPSLMGGGGDKGETGELKESKSADEPAETKPDAARTDEAADGEAKAADGDKPDGETEGEDAEGDEKDSEE